MTNKLSVVVPTYNRVGALKETLNSLNRQSLSEFEVVVVNDGGEEIELNDSNYRFPLVYYYQYNNGPASARNKGAELASGDILLFIGDDCISDSNHLFRIYYNHARQAGMKTVQGFTQWHPSTDDEFHRFLTDVSGIQGNYNALRTENGWQYDINPAFCLTTNWSISRKVFENVGGFDESFKVAAWEDIDLGYRLTREDVRAFFDPGAVNYHLHRYNIESFVERQRKVGHWHPRVCLNHPEMAGDQINPYALREAKKVDLGQMIADAKSLKHDSGEDILKQKYERWQQLFSVAELKGILEGLDRYPPALQVIEHLHSPEEMYIAFRGVSALETKDYSYAMHNAEYLLEKNPDNWAIMCYSGEVALASGDEYGALKWLDKAITRAPGEEWAQSRFDELRGQDVS